MSTLKKGLSHTVSTTVTESNVARTVGSGTLDVFSTPMMIALMEQAAAETIAPLLEEGETSVGTGLNIHHTSATPLGQKVTATATITEVDRKRVDFTVSAQDESGDIGSGTHSRFIVDSKTFLERAESKNK